MENIGHIIRVKLHGRLTCRLRDATSRMLHGSLGVKLHHILWNRLASRLPLTNK